MSSTLQTLTVSPSPKPLRGVFIVPGDKSISHRAVILGSLASGVTHIEGLLEGEDVLCTVGAMRAMGAKITRLGLGKWKIVGVGEKGLKQPRGVIDCGNSGTTLRLLTGLVSGFPIKVTFTGDDSLNSRPMGRVIEPLQKMGARITTTFKEKNKKGRWITVEGGKLQGGVFKLKVPSAQLKSALLLAGLSSGQPVTVIEPRGTKSRDHSERMLQGFGATLEVRGARVTLRAGSLLQGRKFVVPGDISSAAFFIVAGLIHPNKKTRLVLKNVGINPTRTGLLDVLKKMGAHLALRSIRTVCGEPVADIVVTPAPLRSTKLTAKIMPRLIDEIPIISVAAALAQGRTRIRGAHELRIKETDRIRALVAELSRFGVPVKEYEDGLDIIGKGDGGSTLAASSCKSYGDHRMAMSLLILGSVVRGKTEVQDAECIATSFPSFVSLMKKVGNSLTVKRILY